MKKENQDLKNNLKLLNKSLDKILKSNKNINKNRYSSPINDSEEDIQKKIESTEFLILKYKKEINHLKETQSPRDLSEKLRISQEISSLKAQVNDFESENLKLSKSKPLKEDKNLKKELILLKDRVSSLQIMIKEDEKLINEFKSKVKETAKFRKSPQFEEKLKEDEPDAVELKQRVSELEMQKKQEENSWKVRINDLKIIIEAKEAEIAELEAILKEKDKNCRIKKMNIKASQRESRSFQPKVISSQSKERLSN
jgi:hypothetical protein